VEDRHARYRNRVIAGDRPVEGRRAAGVGLASYDTSGRVLDVWFPQPVLGDDPPVPDGLADLAGHDRVRRVRCEVVVVTADLDSEPADAADVYLRLHLLSHRLVAPHGADL